MTVHRINHDKTPKVREYAEITLSDGTVMTGFVFVEATSRILDLLNQDPPFFPLIDKEERIHLVNKHMIVHVRPFDQ